MFKKYISCALVLVSSVSGKYIEDSEIITNQNSIQLSSCINIKCSEITEKLIQSYDYTIRLDNKYYVTYLVNIKRKDLNTIKSKLKKDFPDMIVRRKAPSLTKSISTKKTISKSKKKKTPTIEISTFVEKYKNGLENFKAKKYELAYQTFDELFQLKSDDLNINFYLGRSAYETKRYDEAVSSFERFLFEQPDNNRVKLEMARSFFMTNTHKEAKKLFKELQNDATTSKATLVIIDNYLKLINQKMDKHFINGVLMFGLLRDSNINSRSSHDTFSNVYFPTANTYLNVTNTTEDASNWYNQEVALINYKYKLDDDKNIKQDFLIFNKDSFDSTYNSTKVTLFSYTPSLSIKYNPQLTIDYALYTDFLRYGRSNKLKTLAFFPQFKYIHDKENSFSGYLKYQNKNDQQDKSKDSTYTELSTSFMHTYDAKLSSTSNITLSNEREKESFQTGIDYDAFKGSFALNYKYKPTLFFGPSLTYTHTKYLDTDSSYLVKPVNKQLKLALSTTYIYSPKWIIQGSADFTKQNSNIAPNEYDKYTFGLNIIRPF